MTEPTLMSLTKSSLNTFKCDKCLDFGFLPATKFAQCDCRNDVFQTSLRCYQCGGYVNHQWSYDQYTKTGDRRYLTETCRPSECGRAAMLTMARFF